MEKYFNQTQGLLGLIQATLTQEQMEHSAKASEEMWEAIREISDKYELSVREMMNATLACHSSILEVAMEQADNQAKGEN